MPSRSLRRPRDSKSGGRSAGLEVPRLADIPRRSSRRRLARLHHGEPVKGPWPVPAVDSVEALAAKYAEAWPAWGRRKIAALMRADGHHVSTSTVERALRRRGLLLPVGYQADRKSWAVIRRRVFHDPLTQRNRVWQTDFSEFETASGGIWRSCAVIDYATKYCLAATVTPTARGQDALACLTAAVQHAEWIWGLDDLRADRGELDLVDETTGVPLRTVPAPIAVVSDNGPYFRVRVPQHVIRLRVLPCILQVTNNFQRVPYPRECGRLVGIVLHRRSTPLPCGALSGWVRSLSTAAGWWSGEGSPHEYRQVIGDSAQSVAARDGRRRALGRSLRRGDLPSETEVDQPPTSSRTCVSRKLLPDGSRNPESMPYGRSSGFSVNSTPRADSSS